MFARLPVKSVFYLIYHGSALFTRGHTQALVTTTLGSGQDELKIDRLMGDTLESAFMLQYNFPPFSVGEARQQRGPVVEKSVTDT